MNPDEHLNFYAVIPAPVLNDPGLPSGAKLLYGTISQLLNENGYCYASNAYLMERNNASRRTITEWLAVLQKQGHVRIIIEREAARMGEPQRRIYINDAGVGRNSPTGVGRKLPAGVGSFLPPENTSIKNNTPQSPQGEVLRKSCFSFTEFWNAYGLKKDRAKCEAKYRKIDEADRQVIRDSLPGYIVGTRTDGTYPCRKNPLTWLNGRCWEDEAANSESGRITSPRCAL